MLLKSFHSIDPHTSLWPNIWLQDSPILEDLHFLSKLWWRKCFSSSSFVPALLPSLFSSTSSATYSLPSLFCGNCVRRERERIQDVENKIGLNCSSLFILLHYITSTLLLFLLPHHKSWPFHSLIIWLISSWWIIIITDGHPKKERVMTDKILFLFCRHSFHEESDDKLNNPRKWRPQTEMMKGET